VFRQEEFGENAETSHAGSLPIRRFVLNPPWGLNRKLLGQEEMLSSEEIKPSEQHDPMILPRKRVSVNPLRASNDGAINELRSAAGETRANVQSSANPLLEFDRTRFVRIRDRAGFNGDPAIARREPTDAMRIRAARLPQD
jgi:hypothetical protein